MDSAVADAAAEARVGMGVGGIKLSDDACTDTAFEASEGEEGN